MKKNYQLFMAGQSGKDLEESILNNVKKIDILERRASTTEAECELIKRTIQKETETIKAHFTKEVENINANLLIAYQKAAIVKYDAFKEMGGKLSFAVALLDKRNNGFVLNSMHNREGCYTYIKEIINGQSYVLMCDEEKEAVEKAMVSDKLMPDSNLNI